MKGQKKNLKHFKKRDVWVTVLKNLGGQRQIFSSSSVNLAISNISLKEIHALSTRSQLFGFQKIFAEKNVLSLI